MDGVPIYKIAQKEKWNVLLVSMRAHDESEGNIFTLGVKERYDCVNWANWAAKHFGRELFLNFTFFACIFTQFPV